MSTITSPNGVPRAAADHQPDANQDRTSEATVQSTGGADGKGASPFDPKSLVMSQDFAASIGVKKTTRIVPARKPTRHDWASSSPMSGASPSRSRCSK